ncbi:MAG: hypothetical protein KME07_02190 [Pegethrix bostrychoides GSE-TBD4-15B]|jgi:hypothetical protein|uniref:Uncharacterized protein n=1 Tax=Pegethrix bostrychoides GSE-TBD4-15B TaxID=2839662 RepID=A0A951U357_9CYAN|nr:hypothetical protein [Pegethrix bostrychoides GSE-TBD4-15B]
MYQSRRQIVEQLGIDIDRLFERLNTSSGRFTELDETIICRALQGQLPQAMALSLDLSCQMIRDRLSRQIYPGLAELMQVDQREIAGNWAAILNFSLSPSFYSAPVKTIG